ncbi:hypothetical protein ACKI1Z_41580, partial [Streptomyces galilaeus]|uniref:hypothetical protein n=1 Tax=Streptomyces galilaeus TaxID=33899 RepID=UPI0038F67DFF
TTRFVAAATLDGPDWQGALGAQFYDWRMTSNPTYANADGSSAQIDQFDRRGVFTGTMRRRWTLAPAIDLTLGGEGRYDAIGTVGLNHTAAG